MNSHKGTKANSFTRQEERHQAYVRSLSVTYEGSAEDILLRAPDISPKGMFINTPNHLPEGAVVRVSFQLPRSNFEVLARCEVRYCLPGVGIGVEFVEISPEARRAIEEEIQSNEYSSKPTA
jgi:PilZ domain